MSARSSSTLSYNGGSGKPTIGGHLCTIIDMVPAKKNDASDQLGRASQQAPGEMNLRCINGHGRDEGNDNTDRGDAQWIVVILWYGEMIARLHPQKHAALRRESFESTSNDPEEGEDPADGPVSPGNLPKRNGKETHKFMEKSTRRKRENPIL